MSRAGLRLRNLGVVVFTTLGFFLLVRSHMYLEKYHESNVNAENHGIATPSFIEKKSNDRGMQKTENALNEEGSNQKITYPDEGVTIVFVVCGEKDELSQQTLTAMKSVTLFSRSVSKMIIITDSDKQKNFILNQVSKWPNSVRSIINLQFQEVWYPDGYEWMKKYRTLCTTERLYLPNILNNDAIIYLDTDVILLDYVDKLWNYFSNMKQTEIAAMAPEHEDPENAFYNSPYNNVPYYGPLGLNAGVMLMNLTRMRSHQGGWMNLVHNVYDKYKYSPLHFADQDILNIIFAEYPEKLLVLPCQWNYRSDHCSFKGNTCPSSETGISLLHGNRKVFHTTRDLSFRAVYEAFLNYHWEEDIEANLFEPLQKGLENEFNTLCAKNISRYTARVTQLLTNGIACL